MADDNILYETLRKKWGYDVFRGVQLETIRSVLAGRDTLALMPTGAGKSLTYQLSALVSEGVCIVITPLIALMKDQVEALQRRGVNAVAIHSGMSARQIDITLDNCVYGDVKFLYIAPERIAGEMFRERVRRMKVCIVAVDEAHCISQWGYDFRPAYLRIAGIRKFVPGTPVLALTASAAPKVVGDIMDKLEFREGKVIRGDYSRPNLSFSIRHTDDKRGQLFRILDSVPGSGIIYMRTREGTENLARELEDEGVSVNFYHAGLPHAERSIRQNEWMAGTKRVMVATTAFGMGVDKADVRFVVHYDLCSSLEEYYQEAGRAGRDGGKAYAVQLVGSEDAGVLERRFVAEFPDIATVKDIYSKIHNYLQIGVGDGQKSTFNFDPYDFCARYKCYAGTLHNCIKILEQNGYMVYIDDGDNPARIMFRISRDGLYSLRTEREDLDEILKAILRLYTGVFSDFRPIDTQEIALYARCSELEVKEALKKLWRMNVITYIPKNNSPLLYINESRFPESDIYISPLSYRMRKETAAERLKAVFGYVNNTEECRSAILQEYFGDTDVAGCGVCDVCLERKRNAAKRKSPLFDDKDKHNGETVDIRGRIFGILSEGGASVKSIVGKIDGEPSVILEVVDSLMENGEISVAKSGLIVRK